MKMALLVLCTLMALPFHSFTQTLSTHLFSPGAPSQPLPKDLHFAADRIRVIHPTWYNSLFSRRAVQGCEADLAETATEIDTTIELMTTGPNSIAVFLDGRLAPLV